MYTLIISAVLGVLLAVPLGATGVSNWGWAIAFGVLLFLACNTAIGLLMKKKIQGMMESVQGTLMSGQKQMQAKTNAWKFRPPGSPKAAQIEIQKMQHTFIEKALGQTGIFEPYYKWVPLLKKQVNTLKMQLHYQDRNFREVDKLMPGCLFMDPVTMSMCLARMYENKDPKLDKFFEKNAAKLRYGQGAVFYGLYAWIAVKRNDLDLALKTLLRAAKKMENDTIKRNIEILQNSKAKQFNLAGLGDEWYVLGLEEPKIKFQRQPQRPY